MKLQKGVISHCNKKGISYQIETDLMVEFKAPDGFVFSNQSRCRCVEIYEEYMGIKTKVAGVIEILDRLELYKVQ